MPDLSEGAVFAGHRIEGVAGRGGMGTVYRATHLALDHLVALKVIAADLAEDESFRERFKSESRIAVSLRHPNVVPIHHAGEEDGLLFVTMDLIDGPDLRKLLIARGRLDGEHAVSIIEAVASALDVAHSRGLVHRDIKPGNILIEERGNSEQVYLTDFGLTKRMDQAASAASALTSTGAFVGTLDYVAPEQIRGDVLDARTDVYALGCVLYEMLANKPPFGDREEKVAKMYAHLQDSPPPLGGSNGVFDDVIARALAKEQDDRYPSAGDLARAASAALEGHNVVTAERSVATGPAAPTEQHRTPPETESPARPDPTEISERVEPEPERELELDATLRSDTPPEATAPFEPDFEPTAETELPAESPPEAAVPPPVPPVVRGGDEGTDAGAMGAGGASGRRIPPAALAGGAALVAVVVVAVLLFGGGGDDSTATTSPTTGTSGQTGGGGGEPAFEPRVLDRGIDGGTLPVGVAAAGEDVYIADRTGGQLIHGDAADMKRKSAVDLGSPPEDVVVEGGSVFVTVPKLNQVRVFDKQLQGDPEVIQLASGSQPQGITSAEGKVWVAGFGDGNVYEIDPASPQQPETIGLGAGNPFGIGVTKEALWVAARADDVVWRYDRASGAKESFPTGDNPKGVAVFGGNVYVANADSENVTILDESNPGKSRNVKVGGQPRAIDVLDDHVWVSNGDSPGDGPENGWVSVFDAGGKPVDKRGLEVGGSPEGLGVSAGRLWVATGPQQLAKAIEP